jgi:hypothetical protein
MSLSGPTRRFAAAQRSDRNGGRPDGRRTRPEPALMTPCCRVGQAPIGPLFWNVHYKPIGRSARILSSVSLSRLTSGFTERHTAVW